MNDRIALPALEFPHIPLLVEEASYPREVEVLDLTLRAAVLEDEGEIFQ